MKDPCAKCGTRTTNAYGKHQCRVVRILSPEVRQFALLACDGNIRANAKNVFGLDCGTVLRAVSGLNCSEDTFNKLRRAYLQSRKEKTDDTRT